jgi:hypothetical protein
MLKNGRIVAVGAIFVVCLCWSPVDAIPSDAEDSGEARDLVLRANTQTNIRAPGSRPFQLQAKVQLYDAKNRRQEGTYTLLWKSPASWRDEIHAGKFSQVRTADGNRLFVSRTPAALFPGVYHHSSCSGVSKLSNSPSQRDLARHHGKVR